MKNISKTDPSDTNELELGLKFEFDSLLEEYKSIRQELQTHLSSQDQLINYAIAFIALLVSAGQYVTGTYTFLTAAVYLGASIVFSLLCLMFARYDANIAICSGYITYVLKPRIEKLIFQVQKKKKLVLMWEDENIKFRLSRRHVVAQYINTIGRQGILIIPSTGILLFYIVSRDFRVPVPIWENILFGLSVVANVSVLYSVYSAVGLYVKGNPIFPES